MRKRPSCSAAGERRVEFRAAPCYNRAVLAAFKAILPRRGTVLPILKTMTEGGELNEQ